MSDTSLEQTEPTNIVQHNENELGEMRVSEATVSALDTTTVENTELEANIPEPSKSQGRAGTVEHLAARRPVPPLDPDSPEVKRRLSELRPELTTAVTGLRWGGVSVQETAEQIIPLINLGSLQQWSPVLVPYVLEIDRAGNLIPVWLNVIGREDDKDLPPDANPAETMIGRARRFALLMLGNYKSPEVSTALGKYAATPDTSMYATKALVKQNTTAALQALIGALKEAEGWAKVDIVEACLSTGLSRFYDILLASSLDNVPGLESYIAVPIYRTIPLERYLRGGKDVAPRLSQQAALVFGQVVQDSARMNPQGETPPILPILFEQNLPPLATALFEGARSTPDWQYVLAVHRLASLLGRYWADISRGAIQNPRIAEPVYGTLPLMPEIERWMNGPGREVLLDSMGSASDTAYPSIVRVLGELREPRAIAPLIQQIDATTAITSRAQALRVSAACDTLGRLGDRRAVQPLLLLAGRVVNTEQRNAQAKRRSTLAPGDSAIPVSIVSTAIVRACGLLNDRATVDFVLRAANDFDPVVRTEAIEAIKRLDPTGEDMRSRSVAREALNDPADAVARAACQLIAHYRDSDAIPSLQQVAATRPAIASAAYEALHQLTR